MQKNYEILQRFAEAFGPSAAEDEISQEIQSVLGKRFDFVMTPHGNLIVEKKAKRGAPKAQRTLLVQAHMDELAFRPFKYLPDGFIQISPLSPLPDNVGNHPIRFRPGVATGLLMVRKQGNQPLYYLDVGARNADEARKEVPFYSTGAYSSSFLENEGTFTCKSFDDRAGCTLIAEALLDNLDNDEMRLIGVFTTREETGHWPLPELVRTLWAHGVQPSLLLNLEVCPGGPTPGGGDPIVHVGAGVGIVHMDRFYASPTDVCRFMAEVAEKNEIPHQHVAMRDGGGELGEFAMKLGVKGYSLVIPGRYMHSPHSVMAKADFNAARAMVGAIISNFSSCPV